MAAVFPLQEQHVTQRSKYHRLCCATVLAFCLAGLGAPAQSQSIDGRWLSGDGERVVEIVPCDGGAPVRCGAVVWLQSPTDSQGVPVKDIANADPGLRRRPVCGLQVVSGFIPSDSGEWRGQIYDIDTGQIRRGELKLESYSLRIGFDPETSDTQGIAGQVWARMPRPFARCSPR